jgi:hypothetical protein
MSPNDPSSEHLPAALVAAYLDGRLDAAERARAESHLADCAECRQEVVEMRAVLADPETTGVTKHVRRPNRWLPVGIGTAAAAALLIVLASTARRSPPEIERTPSDAASARLATHAPSDGVSAERVVFVWAPAAPGSSYRLTLTDSAGAPVWSTSTMDTVLALPATTQLARGRRYHWYVDALVGDGHTMTSGVRSFSTAQ